MTASADPQSPLRDFRKTQEFFIGIDSDGCAFDTMEVKHKECFIPNIVNHYDLAGVSKYAREAAEFVNLYSKSRGINRFPALVEALEWLRDRPEVIARGVEIRIPQSLVDWIKRETKLANPALEKAAAARLHRVGPKMARAVRARRSPLRSVRPTVRCAENTIPPRARRVRATVLE